MSAAGSLARFAPGDLVTWLHVPRGGYGYFWPVDGEVVRVTAKRVRIRVAKRSGEKVTVSVRPEYLRRQRGTAP